MGEVYSHQMLFCSLSCFKLLQNHIYFIQTKSCLFCYLLLCIRIMRTIHRIIQTQQILPHTENHPKQCVLVIPPYLYRLPTSHSFPFQQIRSVFPSKDIPALILLIFCIFRPRHPRHHDNKPEKRLSAVHQCKTLCQKCQNRRPLRPIAPNYIFSNPIH